LNTNFYGQRAYDKEEGEKAFHQSFGKRKGRLSATTHLRRTPELCGGAPPPNLGEVVMYM
jgi:hypothetical protein